MSEPANTKLPNSKFIELLAANRRQIGLGMLLLGIVFAVIAVIQINSARIEKTADPAGVEKKEDDEEKSDLLRKKKTEGNLFQIDSGKHYFGLFLALAGIVLVANGAWMSFRETPTDGSEAATRLSILTIGLPLGIAVFLYGLNMGYRSQDDLIKWLAGAELTKEEKVGLYGAKRIFVVFAILFAGLAMIFASGLPAKVEERHNPTLRRLVYGSNALLAGLALLIILIVVNIFVEFKLPGKVDTTETGFYSLDDKSKQLVAEIDEPVNAYLILRPLVGNLEADITSMLNNCERINPKFKAHFLVPGVDDEAIRKLHNQYKVAPRDRREGILLAIGDGTDRVSVLSFPRDLFSQSESGQLSFDGEGKLMTELSFLSQKGGKPIIYFTQGNGELDIEAGPRNLGARTAANLVRYLEDRRFEVKPLKFALNKTPTLDERTQAIVIAGPQRKMQEQISSFLNNYAVPEDKAKKPGKLLLLLPAFKDEESDKVGFTGLETLLGDYGISIRPERLVTAPVSPQIRPEIVRVERSREILQSNNPMLRVLQGGYAFQNARLFELARGPKSPTEFRTLPMLRTSPSIPTWLEPGYSRDPDYYDKTLELLSNDEKLRDIKRADNRTDPIAVLVTSTSQPGTPGTQPVEIPRAAVFGTDAIVSDEFLSGRGRNPEAYLELVTGALDWLRERPTSIGIKPREHKIFALDAQKMDENRLLITPLLVMLSVFIGLGVAVWMVRRR